MMRSRALGSMVGILVLFLAWVPRSPGAPPAPGNLVSNGSFELDADGDGVPDDWQTAGGAGVRQTLSQDEGHGGGKSARLHCSSFKPEGGAPHAMLCQMGKVAVEKGKFYKLSFWARQRGLDTPSVSVALRDTKGWHECGLNQMFTLTRELGEDWQRFEFLFRATRAVSETSRLQLWHGQTGTLWIDDMELVHADNTILHPGNPVALGSSRNLVPNSSFECGPGQWGSMTFQPLPWGGLDGLVGTVVEGEALHGRSSLRIDLAPETLPVYDFDYFDITHVKVLAPLAGSRGWIPVEKGAAYTLSVYLKADRDGVPARLGICEFPSGRGRTKEASVGVTWQRHTLTVTPRSTHCYVVAGPDLTRESDPNCTLWVDGVQLEKGARATDYVPGNELEFGVDTEHVGNVFVVPEPVDLPVRIANYGTESRDVSVTVTLRDFRGTRVLRETVTCKVPGGAVHRTQLEMDPRRRGFFQAHVVMVSGAERQERNLRIAIVQKYRAKDSVIGVNHAYGRPHIIRLCRTAGLTWFRDWSLKWRDVEPEAGRWDFSRTDREIDRILAENVNVLAMLPFPSNERTTTAPADLKEAHAYTRQRLQVAFAPRDKKEFREYVRRTVTHYKGRVTKWQIFNEPLTTTYSLPRRYGYTSKDYAMWVHEAWEVIKEVDPSCEVLIGFAGLGPRIVEEFEGIFKEGALAWCDAVTVHSYPRVLTPETNERHLQAILRLMDRYGERKPILMTEHGYYADDDMEVLPRRSGKHLVPLPNEALHAAYAMRSVVVQLANGVEKVFFHSGRCTKLNRDNIEGIFFEYGGAPRQIYPAAAALTSMLSPEAQFVRKLNLDEGIWAYLFRDGGRHVLVVWDRMGAAKMLKVKDPHVVPHDMMGNAFRERTVSLTWAPVYVVATGMTPDEVVAAVSVKK